MRKKQREGKLTGRRDDPAAEAEAWKKLGLSREGRLAEGRGWGMDPREDWWGCCSAKGVGRFGKGASARVVFAGVPAPQILEGEVDRWHP